MKYPRDRVTYSAIVDRPPLKLPGDARLIVWSIVNLEEWEITRAMARQVIPAPTGQVVIPDFPNWSWHEYGMRVGFWRLKAALDRYGVVPTLSINAAVTLNYPRVAGAAKDGGWEFMGHSFVQMPIHQIEDQPAVIKKSLDTIEAFTGKRPVGWLGPGLTQTYETADHLAAAGVKYIGDWVYDDQPSEIKTSFGPLVTLPYTVELNDIPMMIVQHHTSEVFLQRCKDQFDRLYEDGRDTARIMAIAVHPYISGVPHRIKYFEAIYEYMAQRPGVLYWTGEQILQWYLENRKPGNP